MVVLLWFTQHGDVDQRNVVSDCITDGGCTIKQARKHSIQNLVRHCGFNDESSGFEREAIQLILEKIKHGCIKRKVNPL